MMKYLFVQLTYTFPVIIILALICWPFINRNELFKIVLITTFSFIYTTPWNNFFVYNGLRTYHPGTVMGFIGYVPIEDYMFSIIQTVLTLLWTLLCIRWTIPCLNFNYDKKSYLLIRWIPILLLSIATAIGYKLMVPAQNTFYLGNIMFGLFPMIFVWYGAGNYFVKNIIPSSVAILVPTLYQCWVNKICLRNDVWHVSKSTSLNFKIDENLPFEDALLYFITNIHLVLLASYYDKACGMMDTYMMDFPHRLSMSTAYIDQIFKAIITSEYTMNPSVTEDMKVCSEVVSKTKLFNILLSFFPSSIRLSLIIICKFLFVTDDMIDDVEDKDEKRKVLQLIEEFINDLFADRNSDYEVKTKPCNVKIDWAKYESKLTPTDLSVFRAISRISFYLPRKPFYELLAGYRWDIEGTLFRNEDDLMLYSDYLCGSIAKLHLFVSIYIYNKNDFTHTGELINVMDKIQKMGGVLQLSDIVSDIIIDSETMGRCYIPTEYMDDKEEEIRILCYERNPRSLDNKKLKKYSSRIIQLASKQHSEAFEVMKYFPSDTRSFFLVLFECPREIFNVVQSIPIYPSNASISNWNIICTIFYYLYVN